MGSPAPLPLGIFQHLIDLLAFWQKIIALLAPDSFFLDLLLVLSFLLFFFNFLRYCISLVCFQAVDQQKLQMFNVDNRDFLKIL